MKVVVGDGRVLVVGSKVIYRGEYLQFRRE